MTRTVLVLDSLGNTQQLQSNDWTRQDVRMDEIEANLSALGMFLMLQGFEIPEELANNLELTDTV